MPRIDRRRFLQQTAAGIAAATAANRSHAAGTIPPHEETRVPGLHAYVQRSLDAGGSADFRVSSDTPFELAVSRTASKQTVATLKERHPTVQPIHPGSYVQVERGFEGKRFEALSIETWVRRWDSEDRQGLVTACDGDSGFGLFVSPKGWIEFLLGERRLAHVPLPVRQWRHVALVWNGEIVELFVDGSFQGSWRQPGRVETGSAPIRLGASGTGGTAIEFLDGDIAMPAIYDRAITARSRARSVADA